MPTAPRQTLTRRPGFSLIEVVLALGVVAAAVLSLIGLMGSTFTSARQVALQHGAINAVTVLDGALRNPKSITDITITDPDANAFDQLFETLRQIDLTKTKSFLVFNKNPNNRTAGKGAIALAIPTVVALTGDTLPTIAEVQGKSGQADTNASAYAGADLASMFLMRVKISPLLKGKIYQLDPATYEPKSTTYATGSIGAKPEDYALAYVPLAVDIYPVDLTEATDPVKNTEIKPLFTQTIVVNR